MDERLTIDLAAPEATLELGRRIGSMLKGGEFLALAGPLGAGKTLLMRGVAAGLGVNPREPVVSPTFVLVREYAGRVRLLHADAYRLGSIEELRQLGLEEQLSAGAVVAIEWADRFPDFAPESAVWVALESAAGARRATVRGPSAALAALSGADGAGGASAAGGRL
ncbi:MAG: tRNA (adenosine(37)-N6)-threonylcarbamoyltransferase complex ATPase subunit type 1 TsaE [Planctomycetes bacterium]|nr:tRNA (adenosine(37)-N6)-threonylcarbamoyltransferase complex ATPase subunit type 1 TsaE [Planctomycetota bacterium]